MKKLLIFLMVLLLAFGFVSCSTEKEEAVDETSSEVGEESIAIDNIGDLEIDWTKTY